MQISSFLLKWPNSQQCLFKSGCLCAYDQGSELAPAASKMLVKYANGGVDFLYTPAKKVMLNYGLAKGIDECMGGKFTPYLPELASVFCMFYPSETLDLNMHIPFRCGKTGIAVKKVEYNEYFLIAMYNLLMHTQLIHSKQRLLWCDEVEPTLQREAMEFLDNNNKKNTIFFWYISHFSLREFLTFFSQMYDSIISENICFFSSLVNVIVVLEMYHFNIKNVEFFSPNVTLPGSVIYLFCYQQWPLYSIVILCIGTLNGQEKLPILPCLS